MKRKCICRGKGYFFMSTCQQRVMEGAVEKEPNKEPKIFISPREIRGGRMTIPVSAGRRQHLWTPSSSRGKDAAKRQSGKPSERRDSRERSRSSWFPTTWQQLGAKDSFRQRGFRCTCGLHHKRYFEAGLLAPGAPGGCSPAGHAAKGQQPTQGSASAQTKGGTPSGTTTSALLYFS